MKNSPKITNRSLLVLIIISCIIAGVISFVVSHAATLSIGVQPENGILAGNGTVVVDNLASGNAAIKFGTVPISPTPVTQTNNCLPKPSACGFPDATNTGVPAGTKLTPSTSISITTDGTIIDAMDIAGTINIAANNVIIKRSHVVNTTNSIGAIIIKSGTGTIIEDSSIDGGPAHVAIGYGQFTLSRCNVIGGNDSIRAGDNTFVYDSFIHDLQRGTATHDDIVQNINGNNVIFQHNTLLAYQGVPGGWPNLGDPMNAILQIGNQTGDIIGLLFNNNLIDGGNYSFNANWTAYDAGTYTASNIQITNNRIGRDFRYGTNAHMRSDIVNYSGNIWDDTGLLSN